MPEFSIKSLPEVFVSDTAISKQVSEALARGHSRERLRGRLQQNTGASNARRLLQKTE